MTKKKSDLWGPTSDEFGMLYPEIQYSLWEHTVIAGTHAPLNPLHIMLPLGQLARKYLQPPQSLLILLFGRAHDWGRLVRTPSGLRQ